MTSMGEAAEAFLADKASEAVEARRREGDILLFLRETMDEFDLHMRSPARPAPVPPKPLRRPKKTRGPRSQSADASKLRRAAQECLRRSDRPLTVVAIAMSILQDGFRPSLGASEIASVIHDEVTALPVDVTTDDSGAKTYRLKTA